MSTLSSRPYSPRFVVVESDDRGMVPDSLRRAVTEQTRQG